jgi:CBS domain-containing protein
LVGVFTERDYTRKIVLMGRVSRDTPVGEVASPAVTVGPSDAVGGAMALMTERRVRHLPVVEGGAVLGVVSIGDLVKWTMEAQTAALDQLQRYVLGQ